MTAGLRIVNTSGTTQIDELYQAHSLIAKGTATFVQQPLPDHASGGSFSTQENRATVTIAAVNPICAVRSTTYYAQIVARINNGDGTWTFWIDGEAPASAGGACDYFVFDNQAKILTSEGFWVKDASGNVVFSTDTPPARFVDILTADCGTFTVSDNNANPQSFAYTAGRSYAFYPGRIGTFFGWGPSGSNQVKFLFTCAGKTISGGLQTARSRMWYYTFTNTSTPSTNWFNPDYDMLVLDVTNY
jgi:hypothetical protein